MTEHPRSPLRARLSRRTFVATTLAPVIGIGLVGLVRPRPVQAATPVAAGTQPIQVRIETVSHNGLSFRAGIAEGVRLPGLGGAAGLSAEHRGAQYTSSIIESGFPTSHVGVS